MVTTRQALVHSFTFNPPNSLKMLVLLLLSFMDEKTEEREKLG